VTVDAVNDISGGAPISSRRTRAPLPARATVTWATKGRFSRAYQPPAESAPAKDDWSEEIAPEASKIATAATRGRTRSGSHIAFPSESPPIDRSTAPAQAAAI
jgi:hypothetical protein